MFYSLLYTLAVLLAGPVLLARPKSRSKYLGSIRERLGKLPKEINPDGKPAIWLHAVSVGEALAAKALITELKQRFPAFTILVSTTTKTGQQIARLELSADGVFYFPFDWKFAIRRVLRVTKARLCIVMETELWPNFIRIMSRQGIPIVLANGRISDRSLRRYRGLRWFFAPLLRRYHTLCAQSELDAKRLAEIGARPCNVVVIGNLKYQREQFVVSAETVDDLRSRLNLAPGEPLFLAGSTHEGEEEAALDAFKAAREFEPNLRLVLVPRKPERFDQVAGLLEQEGWDYKRYTELEKSSGAGRIILVDEIGLLKALYTLATVAFVGGSLAPVGGHNLLEACAAGVPVLFGPHMSNFRSISADVLRHHAGIQVDSKENLTQRLIELLQDENLRSEMAAGAVRVLELNQQALPQTLSALEEALPFSGIPQPSKLIRFLAKAHSAAAGILRRSPERELAKARKLPAPTISVGSLSFGGAGKSPMTAMLARHFTEKGEKVVILTRGYGGTAREPFIVSNGSNVCTNSSLAGDEPVMLASSIPGVTIIKDRNRQRAAHLAHKRFQPSLFLLDDGFQHRAVARDFNLLLLDADSVVGPRIAGQLFREPLRFATAADAVVVLGNSGRKIAHVEESLSSVGVRKTIFHARFKAVSCYDLNLQEEVKLESLSDKALIAFCGIANPASFVASLGEWNIRPLTTTAFRDHYAYKEQDLEHLARLLKEADGDAMITTEKDVQRLSFESIRNYKILVLKVDLVVDKAEELLELIEMSIRK